MIGLSVLVLVGFMLSLILFERGEQNKVLTLVEPKYRKQVVSERIWIDAKLKNLLNLTSFLFQPVMVPRLDRDSNIYIFDYGDMKIKKFSKDGKFIMEIGKGRGKGPGEFVNPTDFIVDKYNNILVCDPVNGLLTKFDSTGKVIKTLRPKNNPYRLALKGNNLVIQFSYGEDLFGLYDLDGNFKFSFGKDIVPEQSKFPILMAGEIDIEGNYLYCGFTYTGYICCFDLRNGSTRYVVKTIDDLPIPQVELFSVGKAQVIRIKPGTPILVKELNVNQDKLFIETGVFKDQTVIDVYSADNGNYLYSFKIPEKSKGGYFDGRYYYGVKDTSVSKWEVIFK